MLYLADNKIPLAARIAVSNAALALAEAQVAYYAAFFANSPDARSLQEEVLEANETLRQSAKACAKAREL